MAPIVSATRTSTSVKPASFDVGAQHAAPLRGTSPASIAASRSISRLPPIHDRHQILYLRRLLLRDSDPIQRPLGSLDVDDQVADRMTAQPAIELVPLEQRERRQDTIFHG